MYWWIVHHIHMRKYQYIYILLICCGGLNWKFIQVCEDDHLSLLFITNLFPWCIHEMFCVGHLISNQTLLSLTWDSDINIFIIIFIALIYYVAHLMSKWSPFKNNPFVTHFWINLRFSNWFIHWYFDHYNYYHHHNHYQRHH